MPAGSMVPHTHPRASVGERERQRTQQHRDREHRGRAGGTQKAARLWWIGYIAAGAAWTESAYRSTIALPMSPARSSSGAPQTAHS